MHLMILPTTPLAALMSYNNTNATRMSPTPIARRRRCAAWPHAVLRALDAGVKTIEHGFMFDREVVTEGQLVADYFDEAFADLKASIAG